MRAWRWVILLWALGMVGCVGKGKVVHKSDSVQIPRQVVVQARGKTRAIYLRVREFEKAACSKGIVTPAKCAESDRVEENWQRDQRELDAIMAEPDYEIDWKKLLSTLDAVGSILDKMPIP
jgi:hypothetical protein